MAITRFCNTFCWEGIGLTLRFDDPTLAPVTNALLGAMAVEEIPASAQHQDIQIQGTDGGPYHIAANNGTQEKADLGLSQVLYAIEKPFIMAAQRRAGAKALFLHAAVLEVENKAIVIAGPTYGGKSTLAHYAVSQGHALLSDELAPISPDELMVSPYPRGIRLRVPADHDALALGPNISIRPWPNKVPNARHKLSAIYLLSGENGTPLSTPITNPAEALLALYPSTLNSLAHDKAGLNALQKIVTQVPVYNLHRGPLDEMLAAVTH